MFISLYLQEICQNVELFRYYTIVEVPDPLINIMADANMKHDLITLLIAMGSHCVYKQAIRFIMFPFKVIFRSD